MLDNLITRYSLESYLVADNFAFTASALAVSLLLLLFYRVISLYKLEQENKAQDQAKRLPELLVLLSDFAELQLNDMRDSSGKLGFIGNKDQRNEAGLFFIGAVEYVVRKNALSTQQRHHLIVQLLQGSMKFSAKEISKVYSHALAMCSNSPSKNIAKFGAKSFKKWSDNNTQEMPKLASVFA